MTFLRRKRGSKRLAWFLIAPVALGSVALVGAGAPVQAEPRKDSVVRALERAAHPLRSTEPTGGFHDLRPFGRMVRGVDVVGVGEATHNSKEFFTTKHRLFRYLVKKHGFDTYSLEIGWSAGLRIDDYVRNGDGDIRRIMRAEFGGVAPWQTEEFVDLFEWMRDYNVRHPQDPVRFMGNDLNFPTLGTELTDTVLAYVRRHHPELVPAFVELYRDFRAAPSGDAYFELPIDERQAMADQTERAYRLLRAQHDGGDEFTWTVQHARSVRQTAKTLSYDLENPAELAKAMKYRDRVMAVNTAWWAERTGTKVLLSAHNGHVAYESDMPGKYPKTQGAFLRDRLGSRYLSVGFSFDHGSFNTTDENGHWTKTHTVGPAPRGYNEHTLDRVGYRDYLVDLRTVPEPARTWLERKRPTRSIGTDDPAQDVEVALGASHGVLIHLHQVSRAHPFP